MYLFIFTAGGFEHVLQLRNLANLEYDDFWKAFDDLPPSMAQDVLGKQTPTKHLDSDHPVLYLQSLSTFADRSP